MKLIADHCIYDPIIQALSALRLPILRIQDIQSKMPDYSVMQACLENDGILLTLDKGIPSQAYAFEYAKDGLTVVLLRWKSNSPRAWQQITEIILRDYEQWIEVAETETSVISVSYNRGSRPHSWADISPKIVQHAVQHEIIPPDFVIENQDIESP